MFFTLRFARRVFYVHESDRLRDERTSGSRRTSSCGIKAPFIEQFTSYRDERLAQLLKA